MIDRALEKMRLEEEEEKLRVALVQQRLAKERKDRATSREDVKKAHMRRIESEVAAAKEGAAMKAAARLQVSEFQNRKFESARKLSEIEVSTPLKH